MSCLKEWYRDDFLISTSPNLIQPSAVNDAFASDVIYWTNLMSLEGLKKMLSNSLCFGVYVLPQSSSELTGRSNPKQIGLARLITDEVTFAYMTDVYIVEEYQGKGLGTWLLECVNETIDSWPELRRAVLITSGRKGKALYKTKMGMEPFPQDINGLEVLSKKGPGSVMSV